MHIPGILLSFLLTLLLATAQNAWAQEKPEPDEIDYPSVGSPTSSLTTAVPKTAIAEPSIPPAEPHIIKPQEAKTLLAAPPVTKIDKPVTVTTIPTPDVSAIGNPNAEIPTPKTPEFTIASPAAINIPNIPTPKLQFSDFLPFNLGGSGDNAMQTVAGGESGGASAAIAATGAPAKAPAFERSEASGTAPLPANANPNAALAIQSLPYLGIPSSPVQTTVSLPTVSAPIFGQASTPISSPAAIFEFGTPSTPIRSTLSSPSFGTTSTPITVPQSSPVFGLASTPIPSTLGTPNFGRPSTPLGSPSTPTGLSSTPRTSPAFGNVSSPTSSPNFGPPSTPRGGVGR